jgi:hypothetical protein
MRPLPFHVTLGDKILITLVLLSAAALFHVLPGLIMDGGGTVEVMSDNKVVGFYDLGEDRSLTVNGPLGKTVVIVEKGRVRIKESPCPGKQCVNMGDCGEEGGVLVCVPNRVVVRIVEEGSDELDAVSR